MNSYKSLLTVFLFPLLIFTQSCSSPKDANSKNFKEAILKTSDKYKLCLDIADNSQSLDSYKVELEVNNDPFTKNTFALHDLLVREGLEQVEIVQKQQASVAPFGEQPKVVDWKVYQPTEKGRSNLYKVSSVVDRHFAFCFGKVDQLEIVNFTEPGMNFGKTTAQVQFTYQLTELPEWLSKDSELISQALHSEISTNAEKRSKQILLVLTDQGWVDALSLQRIPERYQKVG